MREVLRQIREDLRYNIKVGPISDSRSGSTRVIRIESLVTSSSVMKDKVLDTLPQMIVFYICKLIWSNVAKHLHAMIMNDS